MCSFATCWQALTADEVDARTGKAFAVVVGEEAHIRSGSPGGPRYDPDYPSADIDKYENLMLLRLSHESGERRGLVGRVCPSLVRPVGPAGV
jgi:hypothetical protein